MLEKGLKTNFVLVILILWISGCGATKAYPRECLMGLSQINLSEREFSSLHKSTQYKIEFNNLMLQELCPETKNSGEKNGSEKKKAIYYGQRSG